MVQERREAKTSSPITNCTTGLAFRIKTYDNTPDNVYIQKAKLNGAPLENCWFYHRDFAKGGVLELWLGPTPNRKWGTRPVPHMPPSPLDRPNRG